MLRPFVLAVAVLLAMPALSAPGPAVAGEPAPVVPGCTGDVNGNRIVNSIDLLIVAQHFGFSTGQPGYNLLYDLNGNGTINSIDLLIAAQSYGSCPFTLFVSDLVPTAAINGFGPHERDTSNGEDAPGDGLPLSMNGVAYAKGIGVHALSELAFTLPAGCTAFSARVGIDDEVSSPLASVSFEVWDGVAARLAQSPVKGAADAATLLEADVGGVSTLRLVALPGASDAFDHGDWADAQVTCAGGDFTAPTLSGVMSSAGPTAATVTWTTDEISGSRVEYGLTIAYGEQTPLDTLLVTDHEVALGGLAPGTEYHYRVSSRDAAGNVAVGSDRTFTTPPSLFGAPAPYAAGTNAHGVAIGDLDGDGANDVVTANAGSNSISVLLGDGDGTFTAPTAYATGSQPKSVALGLLNADAYLDAVTANQGGSTVSVLLGNGNGTFGPKTDVAACTNAHEATLALFNNDALLDIACVGWGASQAKVLLGNGDGAFQAALTYAVGSAPHSITSGGFNGDAFVDLAVANHNSNTISVLLGNGDGTFQPHVTYAAGSQPHSIRAADLDGDGDMDLAAANHASDNVSVFFGAGNGAFAAQVTYATANTPKGIAIADVDGDFTVDILTANIDDNYPSLVNPGGDTVTVLFGTGGGAFASREDYGVGQGPFAVAAGLLDGNDSLDIVTANWWDNGVTVRLSTLP